MIAIYRFKQVQIHQRITLKTVFLRSVSSDVAYKPKPSTESQSQSFDTQSQQFPTAEKKGRLTTPSQIPVNTDYGIVVKPDFVNLEPQAPAIDVTSTMQFDSIPGPLSLMSFAKILSFLPEIKHKPTSDFISYALSAATLYIGSQLTWGSNLWLFGRMINGYGPVVRMYGPFGGNIVLLSRPEHARIVIESEGRYPVRSFMDSVEKYRLQYRKYKQCGPFLAHGPEWEKLRKSVEEAISQTTSPQFDKLDKISDEFISRIITIRNSQEEVPPNFISEIHKWSLECYSSITFNRKLGFLDPCGLSTISDPGRLLSAFEGATKAIRKCEWGVHLWRVIETPAWKSLVKNCDLLDTIINKYIQRSQESLYARKKDGSMEQVSLIEAVLLKESITPEDVMTLLLDMMIIGVNATSTTLGFLLYHLARSPRCQAKIVTEIQQKGGKITKDNIKSMSFLNACIKETIRLQPPIPILNRTLTKDIVVHNYHIPQGTIVLMPMHISSMKEEHFEDAMKFKPERWLSEEMTPYMKPYSGVFFGYGPKACFAKDLAETQIALMVSKILQKFNVQYYYHDIHSTYTMIAEPAAPLKFKFTIRK